VVFGTFIPIKSNLWFDFYQANVLDQDGLATNETFIKYHPMVKNEFQAKYLVEKEAAFIQEFKDLSFAWIRTHPTRVLQNIGRRAVSAFLYMHNVADTRPVKRGLLSAQEIKKLTQAKLIFMNNTRDIVWISLDLPQHEFEQQIHALELSNESTILQNWSANRHALIHWTNNPRFIIKSLLVSFVPVFCILCGLALARIRKNAIFIIAGAINMIYLIPYILVSYYRRYQVPLIGLHTIFIFFVVCILLEKFLPGEIPFLKLRKLKTEQ
jgi:hypothetical protein